LTSCLIIKKVSSHDHSSQTCLCCVKERDKKIIWHTANSEHLQPQILEVSCMHRNCIFGWILCPYKPPVALQYSKLPKLPPASAVQPIKHRWIIECQSLQSLSRNKIIIPAFPDLLNINLTLSSCCKRHLLLHRNRF
jgi:hypothetical protein